MAAMSGSAMGKSSRVMSNQLSSSSQRCCVDPPARRWAGRRLRPDVRTMHAAAASDAASGMPLGPPPKDYQPFARIRESNPYRLLGLSKDASFEEAQVARNFLYEEYKWHEPSREAIELAFESILKEKYQSRLKTGFRPPRTGKRTDVFVDPPAPTVWSRLKAMIDPTVSTTTLINEGVVYAALGLWALFSSDQSFPLAGAFAYSVYKFQNKRIKANPEGPHFGGNPIVGALVTTLFTIGVACALMTIVTTPLQSVLAGQMRQVGACMVIVVAGLLGVYIK